MDDPLNDNVKDEEEDSEDMGEGEEEECDEEEDREESNESEEGMDHDGSYGSKFGAGPLPANDSVYVFLAEKGGEILNVTSSEGSFQQHEGGNNEEPGEVIDQNKATINE